MSKQTLRLHDTLLSIHSLEINAVIPATLFQQSIFFIAKTKDELSIVCPSNFDLPSIDSEHQWQAFEVLGPLGFSLTGIMANISGVLAQAKISIFALSTYDTDYILIKQQATDQAILSLQQAGYHVVR